MYSIVETAKQNGIDPFQYLKDLFETLPNVDTLDKKVLDKLMAWSVEIQLRLKPQHQEPPLS